MVQMEMKVSVPVAFLLFGSDRACCIYVPAFLPSPPRPNSRSRSCEPRTSCASPSSSHPPCSTKHSPTLSKEFDAHGIAGYEGASSGVVHGEGRVEHLVLVQQGHRVEGVSCKQEARVLQHGCLREASGATGVDVQHRVVVACCLWEDCRGEGG